jgi:hypothetical protein
VVRMVRIKITTVDSLFASGPALIPLSFLMSAQPDVMCSRPYSNCFHRRIVKSTGLELVTPPVPAQTMGPHLSSPTPPTANEVPVANAEENTDIMFCSSFFIGLSFSEFTQKIDLTPIIQNFLFRVNRYDAPSHSMDIEIKVCSL